MIPKQIFFVWIGKLDIPSNINYVINNFKNVNPDFKIDLIHESDIYNTKNKDLIRCRDLILNNVVDDYLHGNNIRCDFFKKRLRNNIIQKICDIYRKEILYKYGGIYLDCDTFPVQPFDDKLLSLNSFCCKSILEKQHNRIIPDNFFIGSIKDVKTFDTAKEGLIQCKNRIETNHIINTNDEKFYQMKYKFDNCLLKYGEKYNEKSLYIDHYDSKTWKPYCDKDYIKII